MTHTTLGIGRMKKETLLECKKTCLKEDKTTMFEVLNY